MCNTFLNAYNYLIIESKNHLVVDKVKLYGV
jgi:hypothetical protein